MNFILFNKKYISSCKVLTRFVWRQTKNESYLLIPKAKVINQLVNVFNTRSRINISRPKFNWVCVCGCIWRHFVPARLCTSWLQKKKNILKMQMIHFFFEMVRVDESHVRFQINPIENTIITYLSSWSWQSKKQKSPAKFYNCLSTGCGNFWHGLRWESVDCTVFHLISISFCIFRDYFDWFIFF